MISINIKRQARILFPFHFETYTFKKTELFIV